MAAGKVKAERFAVAMQNWNKKRSFGRMGALAFIGLAVCVFTWGLQYKLSLYDPVDAASHRIPTAKLLSKSEQFSSTERPVVIRTTTSTAVLYTAPASALFLLFLIFNVLRNIFSGQREQRASRLWHLRRAHLRAFFVRPPPIFA
jgi:hypothetical protein